MEMATENDQQMSRELASLKESIVDFRNEMRNAMAGFVRQDVYLAQQETAKAQQAAAAEAMMGRLNQLQGRVDVMEAEKRQNRGLLFTTLASGALALILGFLNLK